MLRWKELRIAELEAQKEAQPKVLQPVTIESDKDVDLTERISRRTCIRPVTQKDVEFVNFNNLAWAHR